MVVVVVMRESCCGLIALPSTIRSKESETHKTIDVYMYICMLYL